MGTRSLTRVHDVWQEGKDEILVNMYRQFDGYPDGHGAELSEFLENRVVGNGIPMGQDNSKYSNGAGCLAAQLVANFKDPKDAGSFYLYPTDATDCGEEYTYDIFTAHSGGIRVTVMDYHDKVIFDGNTEDFKSFCVAPEEVTD